MEFYLTDIHEQLLKQALDAFLVSIKSSVAATIALEADDEFWFNAY
jgi:hypothetical protein